MANSVNPGIVNTEVMRRYPFLFRCLFNFIGFFFFKVSIPGSDVKRTELLFFLTVRRV